MIKGGINSISNIANKFRKLVDHSDELTVNDIYNLTKISNEEFFAAVGWIARENKICITDDHLYKLNEKNLTTKIGDDAEKLWDVLSKQKKVDVSHIPALTHLGETDAYAALGWLAQENKINIHTTKENSDKILVEPRLNFNKNIETKDNFFCKDKRESKQILEILVKNSAESLKRILSDISINKYKDSAEIEKIIDLKFKEFDS